MINLIFITLAILGLVFLYFQQKINAKQENLIKSEKKALKKLRKNNNAMFLNRHFAKEKKKSFQSEIFRTHRKEEMPQVRDFDFPKVFKRKSKASMISN